jgi:hypothetical protein
MINNDVYMSIEFSKYAIEKLRKRNIPKELVLAVVENPERIIDSEFPNVYQSVVEIDSKEFLLRVFVNTDKLPNVIVTAF